MEKEQYSEHHFQGIIIFNFESEPENEPEVGPRIGNRRSNRIRTPSRFENKYKRGSFILLIIANLLFIVETGIVLWSLLAPSIYETTCRIQE